jgi:hypothetical protein
MSECVSIAHDYLDQIISIRYWPRDRTFSNPKPWIKTGPWKPRKSNPSPVPLQQIRVSFECDADQLAASIHPSF